MYNAVELRANPESSDALQIGRRDLRNWETAEMKRKDTDTDKEHTSNSNINAPGREQSPQLSMIDTELKLRRFWNAERNRLHGIGGYAAIVSSLLLFLYRVGLLIFTEALAPLTNESLSSVAISTLLATGVIPLLTIALINFVKKPSAYFVLGYRNSFLTTLLAIIAGIPLAVIGISVDRLISAFFIEPASWTVPGPALLCHGFINPDSPSVIVIITVVAGALVPAVLLGLLIGGFIFPGLAIAGSPSFALVGSSLFAALTHYDLRAFPLLFLMNLVALHWRRQNNSLALYTGLLAGLSLGWISYPAVENTAVNILWGQAPASLEQLFSLGLPLILISLMIVLPISIYFRSNKEQKPNAFNSYTTVSSDSSSRARGTYFTFVVAVLLLLLACVSPYINH